LASDTLLSREKRIEHRRFDKKMRGGAGVPLTKFIAVCVTMANKKAIQEVEDMAMWIEEVKDSPFVKQIVEIAGKDRLEEEKLRGLACGVVDHAVRLKLDLPDTPEDTEHLLASYASKNALLDMINDLQNMSDFREFIKNHGVDLPGYNS
jgi:hypothetical protein